MCIVHANNVHVNNKNISTCEINKLYILTVKHNLYNSYSGAATAL